MPDFSKAGFAGEVQHLSGSEEADESCPTCARPFFRELKPSYDVNLRPSGYEIDLNLAA
jgi:hypothetical protein